MMEVTLWLKDGTMYVFSINEAGVVGDVAYEYPHVIRCDVKGFPIHCDSFEVEKLLEEAKQAWFKSETYMEETQRTKGIVRALMQLRVFREAQIERERHG